MTLGVRPRRDTEAPGLGTHRAGHALLIHPKGRADAQALAFAEGLPADPEHQVVVLDLPADPDDATWGVVARLLGRGNPGGYRLISGRALPGGIVPVGQWLADRLDRPVVVPDGAPVPVAGGVLYVPADRGPGWVLLLPRRSPTPVSRRFPKPVWEFALADQTWRTSERAVVDPLPSGVWLHGDGQGGARSPHRDLLVSRLAYRRDVLTVVLGCPGGDELPLDDITRFWHSLLPGVRDLVRFVTYGPLAIPDGSGPGQALADRLGVPVTFDNGLPVSHAAGETPEVHALDDDGSPGWAAFARQLRFTPARLTGGRPTAPVVVGHRPVFDDLQETGPGRYQYDDAVLEVVPSGLWLRPSSASGEAGDEAEATAIRSAAPSARYVNVVVGDGAQGSGRLRELTERLLQRLDPALRAVARLIPAVQLVREARARDVTTGAGAESPGGARVVAGKDRRTVTGGHGADTADDADDVPATAAGPSAAGPWVRLAAVAPVFSDAPAPQASGAAVAGTTPTRAPGQAAGPAVVASARYALDDRAVPASAGPAGPDAPGRPPLLWESTPSAPGVPPSRASEFAAEASDMPPVPESPVAAASPQPGAGEPLVPGSGGLSPQPDGFTTPASDGMPSPADTSADSLPDGEATAGRPAGPLPFLRLVSAPGLAAPPQAAANADTPGSGGPDQGADTQPSRPAFPSPADPAPPRPTAGPGAAAVQAVATAPHSGHDSAAAAAQVQAVPSPAASAVPPRDGIAREREWLRSAFRQQYNDGAGAVARLLSESPGLRGRDQTPTADILTDLVAARLYLRGDSALLDRQVRAASLGPHIPFARCVAAGLRRLPSFRGATMLRATFSSADWDWYRRRTLVTEWAFCWALTSGAPEVPGDADILIWSMTARRTALLDPDQPARVLFLPGTTFKVLTVRDGDRRTVLLRELSASEISADGRVDTGRTAMDDMALSGLERADRTWQDGKTGAAPGLTPEQAVRFTAPPGLILTPQTDSPGPSGKRTTP
ncbi:hypothetical protein [Streptomyces bauhiniae]|uniref:hypothetical protein n=1 Tax=Streptomyces bauhiniae TaxID=2340725 RepID=UPI0035E2CE4A